MGKIACIVMPRDRQSDLHRLAGRLKQAMSFAPQHEVEQRSYQGAESVCVLFRVKPDLVNKDVQPIETAEWAGTMCGYYFSAEPSTRDTRTGSDEPARALLRDIAQHGSNALIGADGTYAFLRWDRKSECLLAGVDKLGMRPLYWAKITGGGFVAASEMKTVIVTLDRITPNWLAWEEKLAFSFQFGNHTLVEGVNRVGPAQLCRFSRQDVALSTFENFFRSIEIVDRSEADFLDEQEAAFDKSMRRLTSLFPASTHSMLTLSGGFDSRRILAWLLRTGIAPTAYTVPEVLPDGREYQSALVRDLCHRAGLEGWRIYPETSEQAVEVTRLRDLLTDFQSDDHYFTTMLAMSLGCVEKVNYDGLAAGVILGGVFTRQEYLQPGGNERFLRDWPHPLASWLCLPNGKSGLMDRIRPYLDTWGEDPNRFSYFYLLSRTRNKVGLAPLGFQSNAFESVYPYLDRDMLKSALSFPVEKKIGLKLQKKLIDRYKTALSAVPTSHDGIDTIGHQYFSQMGSIERGERRNALNRALRAKLALLPCAVPRTQKARFLAAYVMRDAIGRDVFCWESGKAHKVGQLAHFLKIAASSSTYLDAANDLDGMLGSRPEWCTPL